MDRDATIRTLRERLATEPDLMSAWLFGSVARGTDRTSSDVDVAVLSASGSVPFERVSDLSAELGIDLGRDVQIVDLHDAPPDLVHRVLRDGVLLLDRDRAKRIGFEVRVRNLYFDLSRVWLEYRRVQAAEP